MANTFVAIAKNVLTTTQATVTFTTISSAYTDLLLIVSARTNYAYSNDELAIQLNSSGGGAYSQTDINAIATTIYNQRRTTANAQLIRYNNLPGNTATASTFGSTEIYIPNYTGSTKKPISIAYTAENNSSTDFLIGVNATLADVTAAISSITLTSFNGGSFVSGSRFDLYGIKNS